MQNYSSITSRDNARVKYACKAAASAAFRQQEGVFFAEGTRLCLDLAGTLRPRMVFFTQRALEEHPELAALGDETFLVAPHVAQKLGETQTPQGVFCVFPAPHTGWDILRPADGLLVCEAVQDPANIGAIIRSAAAFGFGGAVLLQGCADPFSPRALRASAGASARLPLVTGTALEPAATWLHENGVQGWAASLRDAVQLEQVHPTRPFALFIGNEGAGLSEQALCAASRAVYIPMHGGVESLNAAVAASVLMFYFSGGATA